MFQPVIEDIKERWTK